MANRFWVGGTANWDATAGTKWATTSGGAGGAAVPTTADDVFFDANSGSGTVTIPTATTVSARSIDCTGFTGTLAHASTSANISIGDGTAGAGNNAFKLSSGMTYTLTGIGTITFQSTNATTQTITSAGKTLPSMNFNGAASNYQFADAVTSTGNLTYTAGASLDLNSFTHSVSTFTIASNSNTRTLTFGTGVLNCTIFGATAMTANGATNVTISASVGAQINATNSNNPLINVGSVNWGNVAFSHSTASLNNGTLTSNGATIYSYSRTGAAAKTEIFTLSGTGVTVTNSFSVNANSTVNRILIQASTIGTAFTLTNNGSYSFSNVDFQDITFAGSASTNFASITGNSGDCGGNTNATFTTPVSQQYDGTAGNWSTAARWTSRVPLPQDDVTFATSSAAVSMDMPRCGKNVNFTGYSGTLTWTTSIGQTFYGSLTMSSGMTNSFGNTVNWVLAGRGSYTFDSAGKNFTGTNMTTSINAPGGTYTLASAYTTGHQIVLNAGTFDTGNYTVTSSAFNTPGAITRVLNLGSSTWNLTITSGTPWTIAATGLTVNAGTSNIVFSTTSASTRTFAGGNQKYYSLTYSVAGSTGQMTMSGSNYFENLNFSDANNPRTLALTIATLTTVKNLNVNGTSGKLMTIASTTGGTLAYLELVGDLPTVDYLTVTDIYLTLPYKFYAGANSTTTGATTNVITTAAVSGPYTVKQAENNTTTTSITGTLPFGQSATAGNLLISVFTVAAGTPGTVTPPSGYTLARTTTVGTGGTTANVYTYYKIASGGETAVTWATTNSVACVVKLLEVGGFTGTPTFDVYDENSTLSNVTSLSTGSGVSNTDSPAYALATVASNGGMGASSGFTNSFGEHRGVTIQNNSRWGIKLLTSNASNTTTYTWTTSRNVSTQLVIFKSVAASTATQRMLVGMGA